MHYLHTRTADDVLNTLKAYRDDLHEHSLRKPHWPLLDRLISRETEMMPVWENIAQQRLSWQQCHTLLEQIFFAGAYGTQDHNSRLKADYRRLTELNEKIAAQAAALSALLTEQGQILNRNAFSLERTTHIVDLIEMASEQNGHYRSYLRDPLDALRSQYDGKYWPSLEQILNVAAREIPEAEFLHRSEEAIVDGRGEAVPDYLRVLFEGIETARSSHWKLPARFTLTDASLAILVTVSLDTDNISNERVKMIRTRLYKEGFPGAWATPRRISPQPPAAGGEGSKHCIR
ncbi:hypothetical protein [Enterobacter cloacae]|uniref:Uncharacterized protein n=1 Tax=Enterobacter cloacae subsp. cloacae TaxID=336306 RepID=A0A217EVY8_ENTCL|nr:hypothetical protein [Enterobacter cloacae]ARB02507.1 conserved hypothetical protein [Enterobacter cloacae subsp. cloacae]